MAPLSIWGQPPCRTIWSACLGCWAYDLLVQEFQGLIEVESDDFATIQPGMDGSCQSLPGRGAHEGGQVGLFKILYGLVNFLHSTASMDQMGGSENRDELRKAQVIYIADVVQDFVHQALAPRRGQAATILCVWAGR